MKGIEIGPICISSGQRGCQGSPGWRAEGCRVKIGVALSDPGYPSDHSLELVAWGTMRPQLGTVPERGGDCCPEFRPEHTHPAPAELTTGCSAAHILRSVCALGSSLPVLEDLVKGDIDLLLF